MIDIILSFGGVLAVAKMSMPSMLEVFLGFVIDTKRETVLVAPKRIAKMRTWLMTHHANASGIRLFESLREQAVVFFIIRHFGAIKSKLAE